MGVTAFFVLCVHDTLECSYSSQGVWHRGHVQTKILFMPFYSNLDLSFSGLPQLSEVLVMGCTASGGQQDGSLTVQSF